MNFTFGHKYKELITTKARYIHLLGGRGRGGSFTATQLALQLITSKNYFRGYFMREVFNDIRDSLWRDFKDRIDENESLNESDFAFNDSQMIVTYIPTGNVIMGKGFKKSSGNRTAKLKSLAGATHVFIEEAEENAEADFRQLDDSLRTVKASLKIVMVFNMPNKRHWIIRRWYNLIECGLKDESGKDLPYFKCIPKSDPSLLSIHSTYLDNFGNLDDGFVNNLLNYQTSDPDYYYTMVLGFVTEGVKGRIFRNWQPIKEMPKEYPKKYGLDFGFNDPVALTESCRHNRNLYVREMIYQTGMTNRQISDRMKALGIPLNATIIADSAEPKSIQELKEMGWFNIQAAIKGEGSIVNGIKQIKEFSTFVTEDSLNLWSEYEHYAWKLDRDKNPTEEPIDEHNHLIDSLRYAVNEPPKIKMKII